MPAVTLRELPLTNKAQWRVEGVAIETARGTDTIVLNPERLAAVACAGVPINGRGMVKLAGRRNGDWNGLIA